MWEHYTVCKRDREVQIQNNEHGTIPSRNNDRMRLVSSNVLSKADVKKIVTRKAVDMCAIDMRPFRIVEGKGFKTFCQTLLNIGGSKYNVDDIIPCAKTVSRNTATIYNELLNKIRPEIAEMISAGNISQIVIPRGKQLIVNINNCSVNVLSLLGLCAGTTDLWTERYKQNSYLSLTVHYIKNWKIQKYTLFVTKFPNIQKNHTNIRKVLEEKFELMGLNPNSLGKIIFVTDQGGNIRAAIEMHNKRFDCIAHIVNNILLNAFRHADIVAVEILNLIDNAKAIVTRFKRTQKSRQLRKTLKQTMPVRWNTHYTMLKSIFDQVHEVNRLIMDENGNNEDDGSESEVSDEDTIYESEQEDNERRISTVDPGLLSEVVKFLENFRDCINELEADKVPTFHKIRAWQKILLNCCILMPTDSSSLKSLKLATKLEIEKRFKTDIRHDIASFLYPKFKNLKMLTETERANTMAKLKDMLSELAPPPIPIQSEDPVPQKKTRFDVFFSDESEHENENGIDLEINLYLHSAKMMEETDLLEWWQLNDRYYPKLAEMAKQILNIQATSATSERVFSAANIIYNQKTTSLDAEKLDQLIFIHCYSV